MDRDRDVIDYLENPVNELRNMITVDPDDPKASVPIGNNRGGDLFRNMGILHPAHSGLLYNSALNYYKRDDDGYGIHRWAPKPAIVCPILNFEDKIVGAYLNYLETPAEMPARVMGPVVGDWTGRGVKLHSGLALTVGVCVSVSQGMAIRTLYPDMEIWCCLTNENLRHFIPPKNDCEGFTIFHDKDEDQIDAVTDLAATACVNHDIDIYDPPGEHMSWLAYNADHTRGVVKHG